MIVDGAVIAQTTMTGVGSDPRSYLLACYPDTSIPPLTHVVATAAPMVARINHGKWIASCTCGAPRNVVPTPGCIVFLAVLLGWCVRCGNRPWGGGWRTVIVPPQDERVQIEAVLTCRPDPATRNWEPGETVADLIRENREHGDPIPTSLELVSPVHGPDWREMVAPFAPLPRVAARRVRRVAGWLMRGRR